MSAEQTLGPTPAPVASNELRDNPLLRLFEAAPPALLGPRFTAALGSLEPGEQSAVWIEQLLADPRLDSVNGAHAAAVQTLLDFGHPWALTIRPEELARFRVAPPSRLRRWSRGLVWLCGPLLAVATSLWALQWALAWHEGFPDPAALLSTAVGLVWALSVLARMSVEGPALARSVLLREVPVAAGLFALVTIFNAPQNGLPVVAAAVPLVATALLAHFLADER